MSVPRPSVTSQGSQDDDSRPLRSKGLLPAIGVGAAVYWITGIASVTTLGLVGIGAGVGYGVGSWIADKMQKKGDAQNKVQMDQLPWAVQVALQHWQEFVTRQAAGRQLTPADVDTIWAQFEQYEPTHAANARALVRGSGAASSSSSQGPVGSKLVSPTAPQEFVPTPPPRVSQVEFSVPQMVSFKPFRCRWTTCYSSFDTSKELFAHVVSEHVPRDSLVMSCMWEGCPLVRRSRSSLLFHLQQKHSEASPAPSALPPQPTQHQSPPVQPPPQPQPNPQPPPSTTPSTSFVPAYHFLARMLQSLQGEEESPLTKSVRLTAALVLRNVAQYSALARSLLRRHESRLSLIAMSNSEAANAIAACLSELSPHRKASSEDSGAFFWAPNR